jgi:hypothetical protein
VPYTWTIYANALRVAERIAEQLGGSGEAGVSGGATVGRRNLTSARRSFPPA